MIKLRDIDIKDLTNKTDMINRDRLSIENDRTASQLKWEAEIKRIQL